ncbi:MAG: hypothetical protein FJ134_08180 [Deltaproteobacteria bacterium]|nr:hypothetical protein [Deltaproteobacteria bacterium]
MLPECRTYGGEYPIPKISLEKRDVQEFMEELRGFQEEFRDCFSRSESRDNFFRYMVGQLSELERKSSFLQNFRRHVRVSEISKYHGAQCAPYRSSDVPAPL